MTISTLPILLFVFLKSGSWLCSTGHEEFAFTSPSDLLSCWSCANERNQPLTVLIGWEEETHFIGPRFTVLKRALNDTESLNSLNCEWNTPLLNTGRKTGTVLPIHCSMYFHVLPPGCLDWIWPWWVSSVRRPPSRRSRPWRWAAGCGTCLWSGRQGGSSPAPWSRCARHGQSPPSPSASWESATTLTRAHEGCFNTLTTAEDT